MAFAATRAADRTPVTRSRDRLTKNAANQGVLLLGGLALVFLAVVLISAAWWALFLLAAPLLSTYLILLRTSRQDRANALRLEVLKAQERKLRARNGRASRKTTAASVHTLASGIAHELNSPLFAISGRVDLLLQRPEKYLATAVAREAVAGIRDDATMVAQAVQEIQSSSEAGGRIDRSLNSGASTPSPQSSARRKSRDGVGRDRRVAA